MATALRRGTDGGWWAWPAGPPLSPHPGLPPCFGVEEASTSWEEYPNVKCWPWEGRGGAPAASCWVRAHLRKPSVEKKSLALGFLTEPWGPGAWSLLGCSLGLCPSSAKGTVVPSHLASLWRGAKRPGCHAPSRVCSWFPLPESHPFDEQMPRRHWSQASPPADAPWPRAINERREPELWPAGEQDS